MTNRATLKSILASALMVWCTCVQGQTLLRTVLHSESDGYQWIENRYDDKNGTLCAAARIDSALLTPLVRNVVEYDGGYFKCWFDTEDGNLLWSLYDTLGHCLIPESRRAEEINIDAETGIVLAAEAHSSGCMRDGRVIIPFEYYTIVIINGFYFAKRDRRSEGCDVYTRQGMRLFTADRGVTTCRRELGRMLFVSSNTIYDEMGNRVAYGKIEAVLEGENGQMLMIIRRHDQGGAKFGVCDFAGRVIIPVMYDGVNYLGHGYFSIRRGKTCGVCRQNGKLVLNPDHGFMEVEYNEALERLIAITPDGTIANITDVGTLPHTSDNTAAATGGAAGNTVSATDSTTDSAVATNDSTAAEGQPLLAEEDTTLQQLQTLGTADSTAFEDEYETGTISYIPEDSLDCLLYDSLDCYEDSLMDWYEPLDDVAERPSPTLTADQEPAQNAPCEEAPEQEPEEKEREELAGEVFTGQYVIGGQGRDLSTGDKLPTTIDMTYTVEIHEEYLLLGRDRFDFMFVDDGERVYSAEGASAGSTSIYRYVYVGKGNRLRYTERHTSISGVNEYEFKVKKK